MPAGSEQRGASPAARRGSRAGSRPRLLWTVRGAGLLLAAIAFATGAYATRQTVLLVPAVLAFTAVVLGVLVSLSRARTQRVEVLAPPIAIEGREAVMSVRTTPGLAGATWRTWEPAEFPIERVSGAVDAAGRALVPLGVHSRGRWPILPVEVELPDPFGATRMRWRITSDAELVVAPDTVRVAMTTLRRSSDAGRDARARHADLVDATVREWRPGDPRKRIHWRQSLRRGATMVRAEATQAVDDEIVVVDTGSLVAHDLEDRARTAWAEASDEHDALARAACSIVLALGVRDAERPVDVRTTGRDSLPVADWRDPDATLAAFASLAAGSPVERSFDRPVHFVTTAAADGTGLPVGSTIWRVVPPGAAGASSAHLRVRVESWLDGIGPGRRT